MKLSQRLGALAVCAALCPSAALSQQDAPQAEQPPTLSEVLRGCDRALPARSGVGVLSLDVPNGFAVADPSYGKRVYVVDEAGLAFVAAGESTALLPSLKDGAGVYELHCLNNPAADCDPRADGPFVLQRAGPAGKRAMKRPARISPGTPDEAKARTAILQNFQLRLLGKTKQACDAALRLLAGLPAKR